MSLMPRPLPGNMQHTQETDRRDSNTVPANEQSHTHALDFVATGFGLLSCLDTREMVYIILIQDMLRVATCHVKDLFV
jgi:hypothetical protein